MSIITSDLVYVYKECMVINSQIKDAEAVHIVNNGVISCNIGYAPKILTLSVKLKDIVNKYSEATELYALSSNTG